VAAILSSDLPRALMTAQAIADCSTAKVTTDALLRERDFGELRGQAYDNLGYDPLAMADAPPGGESADTLLQRARDALVSMRALRARLDGDLVVVSHGLFIRTLLLGALALDEARFGGQRLANTSVTVLDAVPPHALRLFNCTRHLDAALHEDVLSLSGG
jgi:probable phosphoglycerate mutase